MLEINFYQNGDEFIWIFFFFFFQTMFKNPYLFLLAINSGFSELMYCPHIGMVFNSSKYVVLL